MDPWRNCDPYQPRDDEYNMGEHYGTIGAPCKYRLEAYPDPPTATPPLIASPSVSKISFIARPFIPVISISFYDRKTKSYGSSTHMVDLGKALTSKLCIPGSSIKPDIDSGIQLTEVTPETLVEQGYWTAEHLADATGKTGKRDKTFIDEKDHIYLLHIKFVSEGCRIEKLMQEKPESTTYNLKQKLLKGEEIELNMIIIGGDVIKDDYNEMMKAFQKKVKADGPLKLCHPMPATFQENQKGSIDTITPRDFTEPAVHSFHGIRHYNTVMYFALKQEGQYVKELGAPKAFIRRKFRLFTMDGHGTCQYLLMIQDAQKPIDRPENGHSCYQGASGLHQYQPGEHIFVDFNVDKTEKIKGTTRKRWSGHVIESSTIPQSNISLLAIISRPRDSSTNRYTDDVDYPAIRWEDQVDVERFNKLLQSAPQVPGFIHKACSERRWKNFRAALEAWNENRETESTVNMANILVNSRPDRLAKVDLFQSIRNEYPEGDVTQRMTLRGEQRSAIEAARQAPGGLTLIQGPPGTAKTYLGLQVLRPFLASRKHFRILVSHASNDGVDQLARSIDSIIDELRESECAIGKRVVIAHSPRSTADVYFNKAKKQGGCKLTANTEAVQPFAVGEEDILGQCDVAQCLLQDLNTRPHGPQNRDPRVKAFHLCYSYYILSYLGFILGGPQCKDDTKTKDVENIGARYRQYSKRSKTFTQDELKNLRASLKDVRNWVLADADVVVSTITTAGSSWLFCNIPCPELILIDDAAKVLEPDLFPIFFQYPNTKHRILIGDVMQIRQEIKSTFLKYDDPGRNFAAQLNLSLMQRLMQTGFPVIRLLTHFRSVPDILSVYNDPVYDGELQAARLTAVDNRPIAQAVANFNLSKYGKASNVIFFNVSNCKQYKSDSKSSLNKGLACAALNFLEGLCQDEGIMALNPSIMVLTAYQAQFALYNTALQALALAYPSAQFIFTDKTERFQGREVDIAVVDYVVTDMPGFMNDLNRMNVMHSRARDGLYVFADKRPILQNSTREGRWVQNFVMSLTKFQIRIGTNDPKDVQESKWYPKEASS